MTIPDEAGRRRWRVRNGAPIPTRFKLRVLGKKFGKRFTGAQALAAGRPRLPPLPPRLAAEPDGDCDGDGQINGSDVDDDNDLLLDTVEKSLPSAGWTSAAPTPTVTTSATATSSARRVDLNNDEYQNLNAVRAVPRQAAVPEPARPDRRRLDFDGDSLTLGEEFSLWRYTLAHGSAALDDRRASVSRHAALTLLGRREVLRLPGRAVIDRRTPALCGRRLLQGGRLPRPGCTASGYVDHPPPGHRRARDMIRGHQPRRHLSTASRSGHVRHSETHYFDLDDDGWLSDDERDEDADGLSNYDETHGRMQSGCWAGCYDREAPFRLTYAGTDVVDADSDGDGVRDGADDQDHDDVPERHGAQPQREHGQGARCEGPGSRAGNGAPAHGRVQPFNPCEPFIDSRTCPTYIPFEDAWAPFDGPPYDPDGDDPTYLVLN